MSEDFKKLTESEKFVIGKERVLKSIKSGSVAKVFAASNCQQELMNDIEFYSKNLGFEIVRLDFDSEEFGIKCKKAFKILVAGLLK